MNNPFKDILGNIGKLVKGKESTAVGIDIGSSAVKVVEIKKKGGKVLLETYGAIALGPYGDLDVGKVTNLPVEKVAVALKEVLKQSGTTAGSGAFSIPVQSSLIFNIELPATIKERELSSIVPTEARKYIPVPITEVSLDYFILPKREASFEEMNMGAKDSDVPQKPTEKMSILVVATQNDAVARSRSIVSQAGLSASFFEIEVFASIRSNFEHELSPVLLMDFGASRTKLAIVEFGMIKKYHSVERGGAEITDAIANSLNVPWSEAEKMKKEFGLFGNPADKNLAEIIKVHIDYIFAETNNALLEYEKKYNKTISKIIFTGGGALMKGLQEIASNSLRADVEFGRPFTKVGTPAFLEKVLDTMGPEFAVALGLALRKLQ